MFNIYDFFNQLSELGVKIRLDVGQPDIPVDERIISALIDSIKKGETTYVSTGGIKELREKIAEVHGVQPEEVIVAPGSKFLVASQLFFSKKIAIISPYWPTYVQMAKKFGKKIQIIKTTLEDKWLPNFDEIEKDVDTIIINYPNNPTGIAIPETKMKELLDIASELNVKIVSDEVYRDITFNKKYVSILDFNYEKGIFIYSFSKTFSMTGFRIGYAIADKKEIGEIQKFIEIMVTCVPKFVQSAAIKALEIREEIKRKIVDIYKRRVELVKKKLNRKLFEFVEPDGAFYIFPRLKNNISGQTFAYKLLRKGVGIFPGEAFGNYNSHIRISLTSSMLEKGIDIINKLAEELSENNKTKNYLL